MKIERILDQMDRAFSGDAWHGPPLKSVLEGLTAEEASKPRDSGRAFDLGTRAAHHRVEDHRAARADGREGGRDS